MNEHAEPIQELLVGKVTKILFPKTISEDDNGFRIFILETPAGEFAVKGTMPDLQTNITIACEGIWELHKSHGRQFKANIIKEKLPADLGGIKDYLIKAKIGFGRVSAQKAVDRFGLEIFDILDNHPEQLSEIKGLKGKTLTKITDNWQEKRVSHTIMLFLAENGVPPAMAHKVYKHMGGDGMTAEGVIKRLQENPYLIADIRGIGFKTADTMALGIGITKNSPLRALAALVHVIRESSGNNGHTIIPWELAVASTATLLGQDEKKTEERLREEIPSSSHVQIVAHENKDHVTLVSLRKAGIRVVKELGRLVSFGTPLLKPGAKLLTGPFTIKDGAITLDESQEAAVQMACTNSVSIITGRPGTGKTAALRALIDIADRLGRRIKCCAPTGLAAVRLSESTGMDATTIHRLLGVGQSGHTREKINADLVVIDEFSMVDIHLAADLLEALPAGTSVIFVGDVDQLPSVGAGNVLGDLIKSKIFPVARLTKIHRQAAGDGKGNGIVEGAHSVIEGKVPTFNNTDFRFIEQDDAEKAASWIPTIMTRMNESGTPLEQIQVLAPMRDRGALSVSNLNQIIQAAINQSTPGIPEIPFRGTTFRLNDRIRQTRNNYTLEVVNGDIGYIRIISIEENEIIVGFSGEREVVLTKSEFEDIVLNYCGTIHSSQGSEFGKVIIALHDQHFVMLNRNLLYTAITRAKEQCVIIGSRRALIIACKTQSNSIRCTDLVDLLKEEFQEAA